jgi:branched-chain amino acid transport system permease protein
MDTLVKTNTVTAAPAMHFGLSTKNWQRIGLAAVILLACLLPFLVSNYRTFQLNLVLVYAIVLLGINLLTGFNGQISLGHGAFYAIGAYSAAILISQFNVPYWATVPIAAVISLAVGFLFGLPATRLEGLYLALATFALGVATPQILKYKGIEQWTGGVQGIVITKPDAPFGLPLNPDQWLYFFTLAIAIVMYLIAWNLLRGRIGRAIVAIRDQPIAAQAMGINVGMYKSVTFGISAMYAGIGGALGGIAVQFVAPDSFAFYFTSIPFLFGSVIGGIFSLSGAVFGALFLLFVPNIAEVISKAAAGAVFGVFLIAFMFVMPAGVAGFIRLAWAWARRRTGAPSEQS